MRQRSPRRNPASAKLTFVVLSDADKPSRTFKASKLQISLVVLLGFVAIGMFGILALVYTPLGKFIFPDYFSTQAEQLAKVRALESKVDAVENELTYLTAYNDKLRNALGDSISSPSAEDTGFEAQVQAPAQTTAPAAEVRQETQSPASYSEPEEAQQSMMAQPSTNRMGSAIFPLMMPVHGFVTRGLDYAIQHYGLDISASQGEPIVAAAPGEVIFSDWTLTGGNTLMIEHAGGYLTVYKHCERALVGVGSRVTRGEPIALVGSTGVTSTGPHLHFELWQDGKILNPEDYLLTKN